MEVLIVKNWKQWLKAVKDKELIFCPKKAVECYHIHPFETWMFEECSFDFKQRFVNIRETMFLTDDRDDEYIELKVLDVIYYRPRIQIFAVDKDTNNRFVIELSYDDFLFPDIEMIRVFDSIIPVDGEVGEPCFF